MALTLYNKMSLGTIQTSGVLHLITLSWLGLQFTVCHPALDYDQLISQKQTTRLKPKIAIGS